MLQSATQSGDGMWKTALFAIFLLPGNAIAGDVLNCRTQVSWDCSTSCEMNAGPADLVLNFGEKTAEFCRGSRCDTSSLTVIDASGQWDDGTYSVFAFEGTAFKLSGVIFPGKALFQARSDELGDIAGSCEVSGNR